MSSSKVFPHSLKERLLYVVGILLLGLLVHLNELAVHAQSVSAGAATHVPVVFSGGHDTDGRDRGRPVVLVAAALGVPPEVFRDAFSHVHPAGPSSGGPTDAEALANKKALMDALGRYGVTDERLNEVSNYYRYVRSRGELWPTKAAAAYAVVEKGVVTGYVVTNGGAGYSSEPTVSVPGIANAPAPKVQLGFDKKFANNGSVTALTIPPPK